MKMKCPYESCPIPENNNVYIAETVYIFVATIALINFPNTMTTLSILFLLIPILLDMLFTKPTYKFLRYIIWVFIAIDGAIVILSFLGLASIVEYVDSQFIMPTGAVFLPGEILIGKKLLSAILVFNIIPPVAYYFGNPCKKNMKHIAGNSTTGKRKTITIQEGAKND